MQAKRTQSLCCYYCSCENAESRALGEHESCGCDRAREREMWLDGYGAMSMCGGIVTQGSVLDMLVCISRGQ